MNRPHLNYCAISVCSINRNCCKALGLLARLFAVPRSVWLEFYIFRRWMEDARFCSYSLRCSPFCSSFLGAFANAIIYFAIEMGYAWRAKAIAINNNLLLIVAATKQEKNYFWFSSFDGLLYRSLRASGRDRLCCSSLLVWNGLFGGVQCPLCSSWTISFAAVASPPPCVLSLSMMSILNSKQRAVFFTK